MSILRKTETVVFDPTNKAHRAAVRAFLKRKAWVDSPLRFAHDSDFGSVADQVQRKLLDWYVLQEEIKEQKKATPAKKATGLKIIQLPAVTGDKELAFAMMGIASEYKK